MHDAPLGEGRCYGGRGGMYARRGGEMYWMVSNMVALAQREGFRLKYCNESVSR